MIDQFTSQPQPGPIGASAARLLTRQSDARSVWQSAAQAARGIRGLRNGIQYAADQFNAVKSGGFLLIPNPHPFKIYNVPTVCIITPNHATDWLKFRVRAGMVGDLEVDGTDGVENPDGDEIPLATGDITVTSGIAQFEFWIELADVSSVKSATIKFGADPTANGWDDFPDTDGRFIRLGWVDTTDTTGKQGKVRQLIRADIPKGIETFDCTGDTEIPVDYLGYRFDPPSA